MVHVLAHGVIPLPDVRDKTSPNQSMIAQRSMFCTRKKSKIGEVLPILCATLFLVQKISSKQSRRGMKT